MLSVKCWCCGKSVKGGDDWAGKIANCPNCNSEIAFPKPDPPVTTAVVTDSTPNSRRPIAREPEVSGREILGFERDKSRPRFPALRVIARSYELLAVLFVCLMLLGVVLNLIFGGEESFGRFSLVEILAMILFTAIVSVSLLSIAQTIRLGLQMEQNTRDTFRVLAAWLQRETHDQ
jgi:DNA-directed RNA polymerase subunit RPC12/RpoP